MYFIFSHLSTQRLPPCRQSNLFLFVHQQKLLQILIRVCAYILSFLTNARSCSVLISTLRSLTTRHLHIINPLRSFYVLLSVFLFFPILARYLVRSVIHIVIEVWIQRNFRYFANIRVGMTLDRHESMRWFYFHMNRSTLYKKNSSRLTMSCKSS